MTTSAAERREVLSLMGLQIDVLTEREALDRILAGVDRGTGGTLFTVNVDILRRCTRDASLRDLIRSADYVVADGMPLVWASRLAGRPLPERVAGSSLIRTLPPLAAEHRTSLFFIGGAAGTADAAARVLVRRHPSLRVAGTWCPPMGFEDDPAELQALTDAVVAARPDVVFVGLGFPKQERLIASLRPLLPGTWFVNCGIAFSFVSGALASAPPLVRRLGFEWLHRLVQEPRRLARRYLVDGLPFFARLMAHGIGMRIRDPRGRRRSRTAP